MKMWLVAFAAAFLMVGAVGWQATRESNAREAPRPSAALSEQEPAGIDPDAPVDPQPPTLITVPLIGSTGRSFRGYTSRPSGPKRPKPEMPSPQRVTGGGSDAALQTAAATASTATSLTSFAGMTFTANGAGWPPDTSGDVGPSHFVQAVNTSLAVYDKTSGTAVMGPMTFNSFFASGQTNTPCDTSNQGDPYVLWDPLAGDAGRWIVTDFAWSSLTSGPWYECIAVSKTDDPTTGGWWFYGLKASTTALPDFPKFGVWGSGLWMTANMFKGARTYSNAQVWVLNRDDMASGKGVANAKTWNMGSSNFSLLPGNFDAPRADLEWTAPSGPGGPEYAISSYGTSSSLSLWRFDPASNTVPTKRSVPVTAYTKPSSKVPQKDSSETLDAMGDRLMAPLQYRGGSLWVSHTVAPSSGRFGIRWWQLGNLTASTPSVTNQGTWAPDATLQRWMPSMAVNGQGEAAVVYSTSSSTTFPSIKMSGRTATATKDQLNVSEQTLVAGTGSQKGGYSRWGDYAIVAIDPIDNCTFWYSTEFYDKTAGSLTTTNANWKTAFGSFRLSTCPVTAG